MGLFGADHRIPIDTILAASLNPETFNTQEDAIARLKRGELDALGAVMARYQHRLYRFLHRFLQYPIAADDVFQQTWLRVIEKIGRCDVHQQFDAWLFSVARNLAIDYLRLRRSGSLDAAFHYPPIAFNDLPQAWAIEAGDDMVLVKFGMKR